MSLPDHLSIPAPRRSAEDRPAPLPLGPARPPATSRTLLNRAEICLRDSECAVRPADRYVSAHLSALRAATAVVVARCSRRDGSRPVSVWRILSEVAPELREWAEFFAARSERRVAAEAGIPGVSEGEAQEALRRAGEFFDVVGQCLSGAAR